MEKDQPQNYTVIYHQPRIELDLTCNEYCIADAIYYLSNNANSPIPGWCYASKKTLGSYVGITKQSVHKILNKLFQLGVVEIQENTRHLRTTDLWEIYVVLPKQERKKSKQSLLLVNEASEKRKKRLPSGGKESLHNNNTSNNNNYIDNNTPGVNNSDDLSDLEIPF